MHPKVGMPAGCDLARVNSCAPTYDALAAAGALWQCPAGANSTATCGAGGCVQGTGDNPLCTGTLDDEHPCCCPRAGCAAEPLFNWIVGVCRGYGCACGNSSAKSCGDGRCGGGCGGPMVPCCFGQDVSPLTPYYDEGTHAKVNYVAAYQFDAAAGLWRIQEQSSFNTDGSRPTFDMMKPLGGLSEDQAWLAPQPGGSAFWSVGYYPAGVKGVGPPGAMFVLSTEDWFAGTFYMLNQLALDRGPDAGFPRSRCPGGVNDNCWASGNSGEMDFLEAPWNKPSAGLPPLNYTQTYSTQNNQIGRCFNGGVNGGGFGSKNFLLTEPSPLSGAPPEPVVYVAVVDSVGVFVYRIPGDEAGAIWPGIGRRAANATVQASPSRLADSANPGNTSYAMTFTSNCQARNVTQARAQQCGFNGDQGFCGNWFSLMDDTGQPLFPSADCERDVRGGATMPWCRSIVQ